MTSPIPHTDRMTKPDEYNRRTSAAQARLAEALEVTGYSPDIFARAGLGGVGGGHYIRRGAFSLMREEVWAIMAVERAGVKLSTPEIAEATGTVHSAVSMALQRRAARVVGSGAPVPAKPGPKPATPWRVGTPKAPKPAHEPAARSYGVSGALIALGGDFPTRKTGPRRLTQTPDPWANADRLEDVYEGRTWDIAEDDA